MLETKEDYHLEYNKLQSAEYIPEDTLHIHHYENLKSYMLETILYNSCS
jgi:hypothetical protein